MTFNFHLQKAIYDEYYKGIIFLMQSSATTYEFKVANLATVKVNGLARAICTDLGAIKKGVPKWLAET